MLACLDYFQFNLFSDLITKDDIVDRLVVSWQSFVMQLAAFLILVFVVIKFAYKPVNNYITKRQAFMENELKEAKSKNKEADLYLTTSKQELNKARSDVNEIIENAKNEATKAKNEILNSTDQEIARKRKLLEEEIALEKKQAQEDIKNDIIDVALLASSQVLQREVSSEDNKRLVNDFIDKLDG